MGLGIKLLLVGMTTVFTILLLVIAIGKLLIRVTNHFEPENKNSLDSLESGAIELSNHQLLIDKAIQIISKGSKKVDKIEKV